MLKSHCEELRLPANLWKGLLAAIHSKKSQQEIDRLVSDMHRNMTEYLGK